jgi:hypothetical protein
LTIADDNRFTVGVRVKFANASDKLGLGMQDFFDGLARLRYRRKPDKVAGMALPQGNTDLAVGLEAADAGAVTGTRIDDHEGPLARIDLNPFGRDDFYQPVVDRVLKLPPVHDQLDFIVKHMGHRSSLMLQILIAALAHDVPIQNGTLAGIHQVFIGVIRAHHGQLLVVYRHGISLVNPLFDYRYVCKQEVV